MYLHSFKTLADNSVVLFKNRINKPFHDKGYYYIETILKFVASSP